MPTVALGTGATVTFATSGFTASITGFTLGRITRTAIDTTHFASTRASTNQMGGRTYMPAKLANPGYLTLEVWFNPQEPPPIHGEAEAITLQYPPDPSIATPGQTRIVSGFVTRFDIEVPTDRAMKASIEIKISGLMTPVAPTSITSALTLSSCFTGGLVAFWNLGESSGATRADSTANGLDLTDNNTVTQTTGKIGNAAQLALASSQSLTRAGASSSLLSFGNADFTLTAWVYLTSLAATSILVSKGTPIPSTTSMEYQLAYNASTGRLQFLVGNGTSSANTEYTGASALAGQWYFLAARHDASANTLSLVVDGLTTIPSTASWAGGSYASGLDFALGKYGGYAGGYANAIIDAVGIWNCCLTDAEVSYLYNGGAGREYPLS